MNLELMRGYMGMRNMNQRQLAESLGISQNAMSRKMRGVTDFTLREAEKVCVELNIDDPVSVFMPKVLRK